MASEYLIQSLSKGSNPMAQAFGAKTQELQQQRNVEAERQQKETATKDADMHQVFKYAGDGYVNEARYLAQQKGLQVPEEVFGDAVFAKGLSLAGDLYRDDPEAAQRYALAFRSGQGDLASRHNAALQAGGKPVSADDREFNNYVRKAQWDIKNKPRGGTDSDNPFTLTPGQTRYDASGKIIAQAADNGEYEAFAKAYNAGISSGMMNPEQAKAAGDEAVLVYKSMRPAPTAAAPAPTQPNFQIPTTQQPAPAQNALPAGLPAGSVYIGTSNGRAVYQDPSGGKYIDDGTP